MSEATQQLLAKLSEYKVAVIGLSEARSVRDSARIELKDLELTILHDKLLTNVIDGRNAETREAQLHIQYKLDAKWGAASSLARNSEDRYLKAQDNVNVLLVELRVLAMLVNVEISETGSTRLIGNVDLAGV